MLQIEVRRIVVGMTLVLVLAPAAVRADVQGPKTGAWVGSQVVLRSPEAILKVGDRVVAHNDSFRIFTVARANGAWFWVKGSGVKGWVQARDVVRLDGAIAYFTGVIDSQPTEWAYLMRGLLWSDQKEYDSALADFNAALRFDPNNAATYLNRGNVWWDKKDLDRAQADYDAALRLDPANVLAYNNRGLVRHLQHDENGALADFNAALRLAPKNALAYNNRGLIWWARKDLDRAQADFDAAVRLEPGYVTAEKNRNFVRSAKKGPDRAALETTGPKAE